MLGLKFSVISWVWWYNLRAEAGSLQAEARLDYIEKFCLKHNPKDKAFKVKVQRLGV